MKRDVDTELVYFSARHMRMQSHAREKECTRWEVSRQEVKWRQLVSRLCAS